MATLKWGLIWLLLRASITGSEREQERRRLEVLKLLFPGDTLPVTPMRFWKKPQGRPLGATDRRPRKPRAARPAP